MAVKNLSPQLTGRAAAVFDYYTSSSSPVALTTSDEFFFENDGNTFVHVSRGSTNVSMTVVTPRQVDGLDIEDRTIVLAAGDYTFGPWPPADYNDEDGKIQLGFSAVTSLSVAIIRPSS